MVVSRLQGREFVVAVMQGIEKYDAIERMWQARAFIISGEEFKVAHVRILFVFFGCADHVLGNIHATHVKAALRKEDARPARPAAHVEQAGRWRWQQGQDGPEL